MKTFTVYFYIFGKPYKKDIEAYCEDEAKEILRLQILKSLRYHKVIETPDINNPNDMFESLKGIFGIK